MVCPVFAGELWPEPTDRVSADVATPALAEAAFTWMPSSHPQPGSVRSSSSPYER